MRKFLVTIIIIATTFPIMLFATIYLWDKKIFKDWFNIFVKDYDY